MGRRPFVSPVKSSVGRAIVVRNEGQDADAQLLHGEATVSGSVDEANTMAKVGEKGPTGAHCWQDGRFCL